MAGFSLLDKIRNKIRIQGDHSITIGKRTRIRYCSINITGSGNRLILKDGANLKGVTIELDGINCTLEINENCVIGENCFISCRERNTQLTIGTRSMFSRNVKVMTSDGHDVLHNGTRINPAQSIHIGDDVWLADSATILKGAHIGNGSLVGINSTLTKPISDHCVAVGNPAKVIKTDCQWQEKLTY